MNRTFLISAVAALCVSSVPLAAQEFPNKPIQMYVAFGAGGQTDIGARIVASIAEKEIGQPIVVVNKGGAGGQVGWTELSRQKPDGYSIGFINIPNLTMIIADPERQALFKADSFTPIVNQVLDPGLIWVRADSPYKTLADLMNAAKKSPGTIKAATGGLMGDDHIALLMLEEAASGAKFRLVHFPDLPAQLKEILAGNVDVAADNVGSLVKYVQGGQVRALAVLDTVRSKFLPDVPTAAELGYPKVVSSSTRGIVGPKGMDPKIVAKLRDVLIKAMANPEHISKMEEAGLGVKVISGAEFQTYYDGAVSEAVKYFEIAKKDK
jgi:tripartite-type tricarboxylate transporter receptor subunit TctC